MKENIVDVFDAWLESRLQDIHTALPGSIEKYDPTTRKASVKILVRFRVKKGNPLSVPPIDNVPVIFPSAAGFSLSFPIVKGDGVLVLFSEEGIGNFLNGQGNEVDADSLARFALTDAVCIPGLYPFSQVPSSKATIDIDNNGIININGDTKHFVTHAELDTVLQSVMSALNSHTHLSAAAGVPTTTASLSTPPITFSADISAAKSDKVKTG